ncbi:MAG TPA: SDR family oxidoreductase [Thermoanaerobaculia bacterium]|nr:SDR family oxidoreductase [Thermoanaerobaculia bacterium]HUM30754.1 SDR family oxidoreductase [Thermoanaerobaculia bacterium]HXK68957.1 SDR family oxidoreductase [Thermoanaerobaculia bacterium]
MNPMLREGSFSGSSVLITGGGSGLGKKIAEYVLTLGGRVLICSRDETKLASAARELKSLGEIGWKTCDVRDPHAVRRLFRDAEDIMGGVDHLINNAAGNFIRPAVRLPEKAFANVIDIVINGTFACSRAFAVACERRNKGGSILNILATYAWHGGPGTVHSAVAKGGVLAMTRTLAVEWSYLGIRVNAVAPGAMETRGAGDRLWPSEEMEERVRTASLPGRFVSLEEVADACLYLMSPHADYINGECLTLDGGDWLGRGILKYIDGEIPVVRRRLEKEDDRKRD